MTVHRHPLHRIRWENFRALIGPDHGGIVDAANRLAKTPGQVSHFGGERPIKNIGDKVAAQIEKAWAKSPGWLDQSHNSSATEASAPAERLSALPSASLFDDLDPLMLAQAEKWLLFEEGVGAALHPVRQASRLMALYRLIDADGGSLTPEHSAEIINAARQRQKGGESGRGNTAAPGRTGNNG